MARSIPKTPRVIENPVIRIMMFTVLLITPISSSFHSCAQRDDDSRYPNNLTRTSFDITKVRIITTIAKMTLRRTSVENKLKRTEMKLAVCSTSLPVVALYT
jgi:hypothetical protein